MSIRECVLTSAPGSPLSSALKIPRGGPVAEVETRCRGGRGLLACIQLRGEGRRAPAK